MILLQCYECFRKTDVPETDQNKDLHVARQKLDNKGVKPLPETDQCRETEC